MKTVSSLLIIDDNADDVAIASYYLKKSQRFDQIWSVSDGDEALQLWTNYEANRREHADRFPPLIVLLDINMPRMDGFEFLSAFGQLGLPTGPDRDTSFVVMLTSSKQCRDVEKAKSFSEVKEYLTKPLTLEAAEALADRFGS